MDSEAARQALEAEFASLRQGIEAVRRRLVGMRAARRALLTAAALSIILIGIVLLGRGGPPPLLIRDAVLIVGGASLAAGLASIFLPLVKPPSVGAAAAQIERAFPELDDRLLSALELAEGLRTDYHSFGFARALIADAREAIAPLALGAAVDLSPIKRAARGFAVAGCACVLLVALFPGSLATFLAKADAAVEAPILYHTPVTPHAADPEAPAGPLITDVMVTLEPPGYSGLPVRTVTDLPRDIGALVGTRVTVSARLGGEAELEVVGEKAVRRIAMATDGESRGKARFTVERDVTCRLVVDGEEEAALRFGIQAIADARPVVRIDEPGKDIALDEAAAIDIKISAVDDFGLARVELQHRLNDEAEWHTQELARPGTAAAQVERKLDLSPMRLEPGDVVAYRAVATDNDAVSGPKQGASRTYVVRLTRPRMAEAKRQLDEAAQEEIQTLDELRDEVEQLGIELDRMTQDVGKSDASTERQTARLQDAMQRVEALTEKLDESIANTMRQMAASELVTPEMMQKVGELQKLLRETLDEGLQESLKRIQEALGTVDPEALRQQLLEARDLQEQFLKRLDQTLELLKRVQREQQLGQAVEMAEQLVRREAELRQSTREIAKTPTDERSEAEDRALEQQAREQDAISRDAADLEEHLKQLAEEMEEAQPEAADQMRELSDTGEARSAMREASQGLRQGQLKRAARSETQALAELRRMLAKLKQQQAQALGDARGKLPGRLQQMARDALYLSEQQEEVIEGTEAMAARSAQEMMGRKRELERVAREQDAVADGVKELGRELGQLSQQTQAVRPSLAQEAESAAEQAGQAARDIRGSTPAQALGGQRRAMQTLNETAAELLKLAQRAAGASQQMALEQYLKQLEAMAQGQEALNDQTGQQLGESGPPLIPGSGGLQQLAMEQELIRRAMERMLKQAEQDGQGQFGDQLGDVPGQMEEVEEDLRQAEAGRQTLETQGDILRKMLDAQRSLHTKEQRPERKAEQAKPYEAPKSPPQLQPAEQELEPEEPLMPTEDLPLDFEELTREYFRWLGRQ